MNHSRRFLIVGIPLLLLFSSLSASGQWDKKPQAEWTEKDALKVLNDSPWGRTQTFTFPGEQYRGPTTGRQGGVPIDHKPAAKCAPFELQGAISLLQADPPGARASNGVEG
jgi:hypothetical protein